MLPYRSPDSDPAAAAKAKASADTGEDVMDILAQVEQQLSKLRNVQKDQDGAVSALSTRAKAVKDAEAQLEKSRGEFEKQRRQIETDRANLTSQGENLRKKQSELEWQAAELERKSKDIEAETQRIEKLAHQSQKQQKDVESQTAHLESERAELLNRVSQAEKNVGELIKQVETAAEEVAEKNKELKRTSAETARLHKKINQLEQAVEGSKTETTSHEERMRDAAEHSKQLEKKVESLEAEIRQRNEQIADNRRKLDQTSKKLSEFAQILTEQTPQLERGAAAVAMVEQQQEQIERMTKELAERSLGSDPEELQRRDQRIAELTEALRQARGQAGGDQDLAQVEQRNAELLAQFDALKLECERAQLAAAQAQKQLEDMAQAASTPSEGQPGESAAARDLRRRVKELELQLVQAQAASNVQGESDEASYSQALREKAERVSIVADHLRRRRVRLMRVRQLLKGRPNDGASPSQAMATEDRVRLDQERVQLATIRKMLEASEKQMLKRWAKSRATLVAGSLAFITVLCAIIAWCAADYISPARVSASVAIEAKGRESGKISKDLLQSWNKWHAELLHSDEFQNTLGKRMAERRLDNFNSGSKVAKRLDTDLTIDANREGVLVLTMAGMNKKELIQFLDLLTMTMLTESNRQVTKRADNAMAVVPGERREGGRIQYASLNDVPISDERIRYALPIFGGLFIVCMIVVVLAYLQLLRMKRVFDDEHMKLFNDAGYEQEQ